MSNSFAIAAVSAALKDMLIDGVTNGQFDPKNGNLSPIGDVQVSALPPDRVDRLDTTSGEKPRINLFMYQVMPNAGWRNTALPSLDTTGKQRLSNRPLALDLHYFLTAYGEEEFFAEALLGYAMQLFHETPVLTRDSITKTIQSNLGKVDGLPAYLQMLSGSGLDQQVELIKISPLTVNGEEMSRLWMAMQAKYRPTAAYQVSVVLIQAEKSTKNPLPVARQGGDGRGPVALAGYFPPIIESIRTSKNLLAAVPADTVVIKGQHLTGGASDLTQVDMSVTLTSPSLPYTVLVKLDEITDEQITFKVPNDDSVAAGIYALTLRVMPNHPIDPTKALSVNAALMVAPKIMAAEKIPNSDPAHPQFFVGSFAKNINADTGKPERLITITSANFVMKEQKVTLLLGSIEVPVIPLTKQTKDLIFDGINVSAGTYPVRLRVDGVESLLVIPGDDGKLKFDETQKVIINE